MRIFSFLKSSSELDDYACFFDWLFTEKFESTLWNPNRVRSMARRVRKFKGISDSNFTHDAQKETVFYRIGDHKRLSYPRVMYSNGDGEARGWIRHIRNGIAHDNCELFYVDRVPCLELVDYSDANRTNQTAYFYIPLDFLMETYKLYKELEKQWINTDKKAKKKKKT